MSESFVEAIEDSEGASFNKYLSLRNLVPASAIGVLLLVSAGSGYFHWQSVKALETRETQLTSLNKMIQAQQREIDKLRTGKDAGIIELKDSISELGIEIETDITESVVSGVVEELEFVPDNEEPSSFWDID